MTAKKSDGEYTKADFNQLAQAIRRHVIAMDGVAGIRGNVWERVKDSFSRHRRRSFDGIVLVETDKEFWIAISVIAAYGTVLPQLATKIQEELRHLCHAHAVQHPVSVRVFIDNVVLVEKNEQKIIT